MAKIPNSTALSQDLPSPGPQANLVDRASAIAFAAPGQALQEMGQAVARVGNDFAANAMEGQKHEADKRFLDWQLETDRAAQNARENMPADGTGHTDAVLGGADDAGQKIFQGMTPWQQKYLDLKVEQHRKGLQLRAYHEEDKQRYDYARNDVDRRTTALAERVAAGNTTLEEARAQAEAIVSSSPLRSQDKFDRLDKRGPKNVRQMIEDTFVRGEMEKLDTGLKSGTLSQDEWVKAHQELRDRLLRRQPGDVDDEINAPGEPGGVPGANPSGRRMFPVPGMDPDSVPRSGGSPNSREHMGPRGGGSHAGWDIPVKVGQPIVAVGNGTVIAKGSGQGYGEYVDVRYDDGTIHRMAHLGDQSKGGGQKAFADGLQVGSKVAPGQELGYGGFSGNAGREFSHVHYEIFPDKSAYDRSSQGSSRATAGLRINPREYFSRSQDVAPSSGGGLSAGADGRIDPVQFANRMTEKVAASPLNGQVPEWGKQFGITTGSPQEWSRFFTMLQQQESGHRVAEVNRDGSLKRFSTTPSGEQSYGPGQFKPGEYGLKTWADVNNPEKVMDAYIEVAKQGKIPAYFGSVQRPDEVKQHASWFETNVAPKLGQSKPAVSERGVTQGLEKPLKVSLAGLSDEEKSARLADLVDQGYKDFIHQKGVDNEDQIVARKTGAAGWYINHRGGRGVGGELNDPKFVGTTWAEDTIAKLRKARGQEGDQKSDPNAPAGGRVQVAQANTGTATDAVPSAVKETPQLDAAIAAAPKNSDKKIGESYPESVLKALQAELQANGISHTLDELKAKPLDYLFGFKSQIGAKAPAPSPNRDRLGGGMSGDDLTAAIFGVENAGKIADAARADPKQPLRDVLGGDATNDLLADLEHKHRAFLGADFENVTVGDAMRMAVAAGRDLTDRSAAEKSGKSIVLFDLSPLERKELGGALRDPAKTLGDVLSADRVAQIAREHPELNADTPVRDAVSVLGGTGATPDERQFYTDQDAPFKNLTGQQRRKLVNVIEDRLNKGMGQMRSNADEDFKNHLASLKAGGEGKDINWRTYEGMFSVRQVAEMKKKDEQARVYGEYSNAFKDVRTMPEAEIRTRLQSMAPSPDDPHYAYKLLLQKNAAREFLAKLGHERRVDPAGSVDEVPEVKAAREDANTYASSQSPPAGYRAKLVEARLEAQRLAGIPTVFQRPINNSEAQQLAQYVTGAADRSRSRELLQGVMAKIRNDYGDRHAMSVFNTMLVYGMKGASTEEKELAGQIMQRTIRNEKIPAADWYKFSQIRQIDNETFKPDNSRPDTPLARQPQAPQPGGATTPAQRTELPQITPGQAAMIEKHRADLERDPAFRAGAEQRAGMKPGTIELILKSKR